MVGWKKFSDPGNLILSEVCRGIDQCQLFACDLTYLNMNVLFELGYATSKNKPIWIAIDPSIDKAKENYDKLGFLATVINIPYHNHFELAQALLADNPFAPGRSSLLQNVIRSAQQENSRLPTFFYLKSEINTEASDRLNRRLKQSGLSTVIDDPEEISTQTLAWYVQNTLDSYAVIAHFLGDDRPSKLLQNQKYSFVAGMAHGFDRKLLMLAPEPFIPGMDYRDLLYKHQKAAECIKRFDAWLLVVRDGYDLLVKEFERRHIERRTQIELRSLNLGDYLAENERQELLDYFVVTYAYTEALQGRPTMIYVGRKGTGKTANLVKLADYLKQDRRYHVCIIEPPNYEQTSVMNLLKAATPEIEKGYVTESLWKFLIETELAKNVYDEINSRPVYSPPSVEEAEFQRYMDENSDVLGAEFAVRMANAINRLLEIDPSQPMPTHRAKLSEILHREILAHLREHLGRVLERKKKVFILIDNLDKAWTRKTDIPYLSEFLFGLLGVSRAISDEFQRSGPTWRRVPLSITIFLRSDIFSHVMAQAREADKVEWARIDWNDPTLLQRLLEDRIVNSVGDSISPADVWLRFFVPTIDGMATKDFIVSRILPRPRDMIYFSKAALASAINHRRAMIQAEDIINAEKEYSYFAFNSLVAETAIEIEQIEDLLLRFANSNQIVTRNQIIRITKEAGIPDSRIDEVISLLTDSNFLGLETDLEQYEFIYEETANKLIRSKARQTAERRAEIGQDERFRVNVPYHAWLDIRSG